jgi:4-hydroxy-tetrahydrodipicolinate reductase
VSGNLGIIGAHGRLGRRVAEAATAAGWRLTLSATSADWIESDTPDVVIDASNRSCVERVAAYCAGSGAALLEAISGLGADERRLLAEASERVPVLVAANLSQGHYLQTLALAAALRPVAGGREWSVLVSDRHPTTKRDRPSATCLELARRCEEEGAVNVELSSRREGPPVSEHSIQLGGAGESVTITHSVTDLIASATGALAAASWLKDAAPGIWTMRDVWEADRHPGRAATEMTLTSGKPHQ